MRQASLLAVFLGALAYGQSPMFEVASVKPSPPVPPTGGVYFGPPRGGPATSDPERITWSYATLKSIFMAAYGVENYQITGPDWLDTERYDIIANVPLGTSKERVGLMWQRLLADRFGAKLHHETKEFQVQELVVGKGGSKLKETTQDLSVELPPGPPQFDKDRGLVGPGFVTTIRMDGGAAHTMAVAQPLSKLVAIMTAQLKHPVLDKTGLTGKYDFTLNFTVDVTGFQPPPGQPAATGDAAAPLPDIAAAVQQQLGLRLNAAKASLDMVVIDQVEKIPTEN